MSEPRDLTLSPEQLDLKIATREGVAAVGGQVEAAQRVDLAQSRISDACSKNTAHFLSIDQAARIEDRIAGVPPITRVLARRQGFALFRLPCPHQAETIWSRHAAAIAKEANEVVTRICDGLADDNDISPKEARHAMVETDEAIDALVRLRAALAERAGGQAERPLRAVSGADS